MGRSPRTVHCGNVFAACCLALALLGACSAGVKATPSPAGTGGNDGGAVDVAPAVDTARPVIDAPAIDINVTPPTDGACVPVSCTPPGGQYCGQIGDGCHAREGMPRLPRRRPDLHRPHLRRGTDVRPRHLHRRGRRSYCGRIGTGCGDAIDCAACPAGQSCSSDGVCVPANCTPARLRHPRRRRRKILRPDRRRLRQDDRLHLRRAADLRRHRHPERVRRSELRTDHVQPGGRRAVLRTDRQRLRQGARLSGHLHRAARPARRTTSARAAAAPPAAACSARS